MKRLSERSIRLLHLADLHFGTETYGRIDPATGVHSRLLDFSRTLEQVLDQAFELDINAVLFAGDAYRTNRPTPTQERELARHIERIGRAGLPLVMIVGNHDLPPGQGQASAIEVFRTLKLPNLHVIDRPETIRIETRRGPLQVVCVPYPTRHKLFTREDVRQLSEDRIRQMTEEALTRFIAEEIEKKNPEQPLALLAHLAVSEATLSGTERMILLAEEPKLLPSVLTQVGIDYAALGHIHRFQDLNPKGQPPVVYPGALERIDFGEEKDKKGFVIADVEPARARYQFFPLACRSFVTIEIDLTEERDPTEALRQRIEKENVEGAIVRVQCIATEEQSLQLDLKQIDETLRAADFISALNVRPPEEPSPRRRSHLTETSTVEEALTTYFEQQHVPRERHAELLLRARQLEDELNKNVGS